jgi:hypothetical protein
MTLGRLVFIAFVALAYLALRMPPSEASPSGAAQGGTPAAGILQTIEAIAAMETAMAIGAPVTAPAVTPAATEATPNSLSCAAESGETRSWEDVLAIIGSQDLAISDPVAGETPTSVEVPLGVPAGDELAAAVADTLRGEAACFNANMKPRAFAYSTEDRFRREPLLVSTERIDIIAVTNASRLDDGRVGAFGIFTDQSGKATTKYYVFVQEVGRWLIDESIAFGGT